MAAYLSEFAPDMAFGEIARAFAEMALAEANLHGDRTAVQQKLQDVVQSEVKQVLSRSMALSCYGRDNLSSADAEHMIQLMVRNGGV